MALNYQSSTLSLTLPISCQICLGKVRQPVICSNHHVFCSSCMETWLKKASQCPTCRVPITPENPCREIIGGTNEGDYTDNPTVKKGLRKTRGELLFQEYEEEIEDLVKENMDLKSKNQVLEDQLRTALQPCSQNKTHPNDKRVPPVVLEEWSSKLQAATDVCDKIQQDIDKLKEANKTLRSQNVDLVQENMRLKAEVASRSPQKFGRYTVAALEAKIQQYERDVEHLKRALERSDQYIEDLESRFRNCEKKKLEEPLSSSKAPAEVLAQQQKINMMMRSLSDGERSSICSNPEAECHTFPRNQGVAFVPSTDQKDCNMTGELKTEESNGSSDFLPTTPSSAFRSLTLRSPGIREKRVAFKPMSHFRRLNFEEYPSPGKNSAALENKFRCLEKFPKGLYQSEAEPSKSVFWGSWQRSHFLDFSHPGTSKDGSERGATSTSLINEEPDSFQVSSEACMDAAYLDKISELDSMMLDGESSSSRGSQLSLASSPHTDLDSTLVPDAQICPAASLSLDDKSGVKGENTNCTLNIQPALQASEKEACPALERPVGAEPCQTEELSFDLLFGPTEDVKTGPVGSLSPETRHQDPDPALPPSSSPSGCSERTSVSTRDRQGVSGSQPVKRKSHSPFSTNSPTKLSKLM